MQRWWRCSSGQAGELPGSERGDRRYPFGDGWNSNGAKWIRLSRQTSQVCRPGISIGVTGMFLSLKEGDEPTVGADETVFGTAGDPE